MAVGCAGLEAFAAWQTAAAEGWGASRQKQVVSGAAPALACLSKAGVGGYLCREESTVF